MFLLSFLKSQLRRAPPRFADSREFQGFGEGFEGKTSKSKPLEVPQSLVRHGFAALAGLQNLTDVKRPALARSRVHIRRAYNKPCCEPLCASSRARSRVLFT
jgi:hypothetical protein